MAPTDRLPPQPWMTDDATSRVVEALRSAGADVRFVGGCVRDALAARPVKDVDLATPALPETVLAALAAAGLKAIPTGLAHGTVTAISAHRPYEITTLRRDVATFGRHATVAFTDDWQADAARRDFTMNAMSCTPQGELFDYFGGAADLAAGQVRFVGDATARLTEDILRLLRFFRFHAGYGRGEPDPVALAACAAMAPRLPMLSGERVAVELLRLLAVPDPVATIALMAAAGVFRHLLPQIGGTGRLAALVVLEAGVVAAGILTVRPDPLRRLAALPDGKHVPGAGAAVASRLRLSRADSLRLAALVDAPPPEALRAPSPGSDALRRVLYRLGPERTADMLLLEHARRLAAARDTCDANAAVAALAPLLCEAWHWPVPRLPVAGADVVALGIAPGPRVGTLLQAVERWWEEDGYRADRAACLDRLRRLAAATA